MNENRKTDFGKYYFSGFDIDCFAIYGSLRPRTSSTNSTITYPSTYPYSTANTPTPRTETDRAEGGYFSTSRTCDGQACWPICGDVEQRSPGQGYC
jgi:hypothetical protein